MGQVRRRQCGPAAGRQRPGDVPAERPWSRYLLLALAKRYGLNASRNRRWPELTVVVAGPEDVLDDLALQFEILSQGLANDLAQTTRRIIGENVGQVQDYTWLRWSRF
jgi:hypothetical protein